jgi:hypothetical protein
MGDTSKKPVGGDGEQNLGIIGQLAHAHAGRPFRERLKAAALYGVLAYFCHMAVEDPALPFAIARVFLAVAAVLVLFGYPRGEGE